MPRKRDDDHLTSKQRASIPIVAVAQTMHAGVLELVARKIVGSTQYFYNAWWREPEYVSAVAAARLEIFGTLRNRSLAKLMAFHEDALNALIAGALKPTSQQVMFLRLYFEMEGYLAGAPLLPKAQVAVNVVADNGRMKLPDRMAKHVEGRNELLRVLNARRIGVEVLEAGSNGNGNGNGNGGAPSE